MFAILMLAVHLIGLELGVTNPGVAWIPMLFGLIYDLAFWFAVVKIFSKEK